MVTTSARNSANVLSSNNLRQRAEKLLNNEIHFVDSRDFRGESRGKVFDCGEADQDLPRDMPGHLARLCEAKLLSAQEERDAFFDFNYHKWLANHLRSRIDLDDLDEAAIRRAEAALHRAEQVRGQIIRANMRLVISIVKRFVTPQHAFDDLLSDGIVSLVNSVDKFNFEKGFRFSTYAYRAITRQLYRTIGDHRKRQQRWMTQASEVGLESLESGSVDVAEEQEYDALSGLLDDMIGQLDRRERFIIRSRHAIGGHRCKKTFQRLADVLGVSKERVRQLEQRALSKLKTMAEEFMDERDLDQWIFSVSQGS